MRFGLSVTAAHVRAERDRRLEHGFTYDFGDERGVHEFDLTQADMIGWNEVTVGAQTLLNVGMPDTVINIETNTGMVAVTALEWQSVILSMMTFRQPIWQASFIIEQMQPIPHDFTDDKWWVAENV